MLAHCSCSSLVKMCCAYYSSPLWTQQRGDLWTGVCCLIWSPQVSHVRQTLLMLWLSWYCCIVMWASSELQASLSSSQWYLSIHFHQTSWSQLIAAARVILVVVLASVVALVLEVDVSDKWGMLLPVLQCPCWCQATPKMGVRPQNMPQT